MATQRLGWEDVVGRWYASGFGDVPWRQTLRSTARLMGGASSAFFELDRETGTIGLFEVEGLEPGGSPAPSATPKRRLRRARVSPKAGCAAWSPSPATARLSS